MSQITIPRDHPVTVELIDKTTGEVVDTSTTTAELLGAHYTMLSYMFRPLGVHSSGWYHPTKGTHYARGLTVKATVTNPETGELVEVDPL